MRAQRHRGDTGLSYRGLPIHAPPGVHEAVFSLMLSHVEPGQRVVELGAGHGAFARRLAQAGYVVEAVDFDVDTDRVPVDRFTFRHQDLNQEVWHLPARLYDAAVAVEVIEHVENPFLFVRNARRLLKARGVLIITTPNVLSVESRRRLLLEGRPAFFMPGGLFEAGHGCILPYWLLEDILRKEGYAVVERRFVGRQPVVMRPGRAWWKRAIVPLADAVIAALGVRIPGDAAFTTTLCAVARRTDEG